MGVSAWVWGRVVAVRASGSVGEEPVCGTAGVSCRCRGSASGGAWGSPSARPPGARYRHRHSCRRPAYGGTGPVRPPPARRRAARRPRSGAGERRPPEARPPGGGGWCGCGDAGDGGGRGRGVLLARGFCRVHGVRRASGVRRVRGVRAVAYGCSGAVVHPGQRGDGRREFGVFGTRRELAQRAERSAVAVPRFARIGETPGLPGRRPVRCAESCVHRCVSSGARVTAVAAASRTSTRRCAHHPPPSGRLISAPPGWGTIRLCTQQVGGERWRGGNGRVG